LIVDIVGSSKGYLQSFKYTKDSKPEGQQLDLLEFQCFLDASTPTGTPCALGSVLVELNTPNCPKHCLSLIIVLSESRSTFFMVADYSHRCSAMWVF